MTLEHTSPIIASSSRTSASVDGKGKRLARPSWSRRSIKWSADDSSKNSRCNGRCAGPIFCCRPGPGSSTRTWTTYSAVGIQNSGRNQKRRSQSARRLDPRLFGALLGGRPGQRLMRRLGMPHNGRTTITRRATTSIRGLLATNNPTQMSNSRRRRTASKHANLSALDREATFAGAPRAASHGDASGRPCVWLFFRV
jgi:hypothetical protein